MKSQNIHDIQDKPKIIVGSNSKASKLVNKKFIQVSADSSSVGSLRQPAPETDPNEGTDDMLLRAPEYSDILIKYENAYENVNFSHNYGALYNISTTEARVKLDFKVMIPLDLAEEVVGVEILSGDEVIAST